MFFKILKNDLRRKKTMNAILFLLIIVASTFLAGSANNLYTTMGAIDYFCDKANTSDFMAFSGDKRIDEFVQNSEYVTDFEKADSIGLNVSKIRLNETETIDSYSGIFLLKLPEKYNLVFDRETDKPFTLKEGEIAICVSDSLTKGIDKGDTLTITAGKCTQTFTVTHIFKDAVLGSQTMGIKRFLVSDDDYARFADSQKNIISSFYSIKTNDVSKFSTEFYKSGIDIYTSFSGDMVKATFYVDMMTAAIFIVVSVALIIISLVILNFTIGYTISEDYKEIGIMKAIGMSNGGIKRIYLTKYFFFALLGSAIGMMLSVPFGNTLNSNIGTNMCLPPVSHNIVINMACAPIIVMLVTGFSFISAGKLNKLTAMQAIRSGMSGENYSRKSLINLHKRSHMKPAGYMAVNDIFHNFRQYMSLFITFTVGTVLIIVPLNMVNTLKDGDEMVKMFGYKPADIYVMTNHESEYYKESILKETLEKIETEYREQGLDLDFDAEYMISLGMHKEGEETYQKVLTNKAIEKSADNYRYTQGTAPMEANEIALTELLAEKLDVNIGDYVIIDVNGESEKLMVTGMYESLFNYGIGARFSQTIDASQMPITGTQMISADFPEGSDAEALRERMQKITPDYIIRNSDEFVEYIIGNIITTVDAVKSLVVLLVLGINCLVTVLVSKMLFARDINSIAMLRSLGFSSMSIKSWQLRRIIITLIVSILFGIGLAMLLNAPIAGTTFGMMGASKIEVVINPIEVFVMYPVILLVVTIISACFATTGARKIGVRDLSGNE